MLGVELGSHQKQNFMHVATVATDNMMIIDADKIQLGPSRSLGDFLKRQGAI